MVRGAVKCGRAPVALASAGLTTAAAGAKAGPDKTIPSSPPTETAPTTSQVQRVEPAAGVGVHSFAATMRTVSEDLGISREK